MIGKTLVHYEITAEIGKGGMGEVYQAKDTKLGRDVAIKVLPEEFALDTDRVARFQREAKLLASLNHPNIAAIYGLEESEGTHFLVMELIEGDTLRDRIKSGPIPVEEALRLALQMAEALEAAHEKGVIHRDLKPANIKVTPDGKVKILDFGLAKAYVGDPENMSPMDSPTISAAATQQGVILGTAAYMSPEQARGETVDKKADIWAFGAVLFEVLTGRQVFTGRTVSDTLASVLAREPEWNSIPPNLHSRIRLLLERSLEKDPKDRYGSISDARVDIQKALMDPSGVFTQPVITTKPRKKLRLRLPWVGAVAILCIVAALILGWNLKPSEPRQVMRFYCELSEEQEFGRLNLPVLAISPDGNKIVYSTTGGLYLRSVDELEARLISGTNESPSHPFFSPDGNWIGYYSIVDRQLKKVAVRGGVPVALCNVGSFAYGSWGTDNTIVYGDYPNRIMRISANGGTSEVLVETDGSVWFPQILSDGKSIQFSHYASNTYQIVAKSIESGEQKEVISGYTGRYLPTGHLIYGLEGNLYAVPFDLDTLEVTGGAVPLVEGVLQRSGLLQYAISDSGTLIYIPGSVREGGQLEERMLVWVDREGKEDLLSANPNDYGGPRISPDGKWVALTIDSGVNEDIWIWDVVRENMTRLTLDEASDEAPLWTPDGNRIVFASNRESGTGVFWKAADGAGEVEPVTKESDTTVIPASWSADEKILVLATAPSSFDIEALSMGDEPERSPLLHGEYAERQPQISPDGQWIAYSSDESGEFEVYVRPFPDVNKRRFQVSTSGGSSPLWSPDGSELFYRNGNSIMAVTVQIEPDLSFGTPKILFSGIYASPNYDDLSRQTMWDIHPDGKQFLMIKPEGATDDELAAQPPSKINVVVNWVEELKQRVPVD